jgi:hypothetical protein
VIESDLFTLQFSFGNYWLAGETDGIEESSLD